MNYLTLNGQVVNYKTNRRTICQKEKVLMGQKEADLKR